MNQDRPRDWRELCKAAAIEPDPNKFMALVAEINAALEEYSKRSTGVEKGKDAMQVLPKGGNASNATIETTPQQASGETNAESRLFRGADTRQALSGDDRSSRS